MRIRSIKPEFWRSEDIAALPLSARLTFIGLWSYVDDNGVGEDRNSSIAADLYADDLACNPHETLRRVSGDTQALENAGLIVRYMVGKRHLLYVTTWKEHQVISRPSKGHCYPLPTAETIEAHANYMRPSGDPIARSRGTGEQGNRGTGDKEHAHPKGASERTAPSRFDEFWSLVPRKVGKDKARTAYAAAVKRAGDEQTVIDGMRRFAADPNLPEPRFIPHPTTWLSRGGWEDDPLPSRTPSPQESHTFGTRPEDWLQGLTEPDDQNVLDGEVLSWPEIGA